MPEVIIADTSCFVLLDKTALLPVLRDLYGTVTTTRKVAEEFGLPLPDFITIESPASADVLTVLETQVDAGEASALALALEKDSATLILDDLKARKLARELHLSVTGTLGVLLKAKQAGFINALAPVLLQIQETNFRISPSLLKKFLSLAGEDF